MKKITILLLTITPCFFALSQQENTLPQQGNVGIGTMTPQVKLDVKGKVSIDSTLIVKDSAIFEDDAHIKKVLTVDDNEYYRI
jgi:hypothetical protein